MSLTGALFASAVRAEAATTPVFVQEAAAHASSVPALSVTPGAAPAAGDRLIVQVAVWSSSNATTKAITDSGGDSFIELLHFAAADHTEMSVWTAPVTSGAGVKVSVTATPTSTADMGLAVLEYSGLSAVADSSVVDQSVAVSGSTGGSAATVSSGSTNPTSSSGELALGLYADSGFGDSLIAASGWNKRVDVSPTGNMEFLAEDQLVGAGATPDATVGTGPGTTWLMSTLVLKGGTSTTPTVPSTPTGVVATAGNASASVTWTAPNDGGSAIISYTVTPYTGGTALTPTVISGAPPATSATFTGLTNGATYTFTVYASNSVGAGPSSALSNPVTPSITVQGQMGPLTTWPIVAVHSVLMANGKSLLWDGWQQPEPTYVWNPSSQSFEATVNAPDSIFCSGTADMPDGRVLVIGGYGGLTTGQQGLVDTSEFDPATQTWTRVADMHAPRWYPDLTELPDGRYVAISGASTSATTYANTPEVYDPVTNSWTQLGSISTSQVQEPEYPFSYLLPNGNVYVLAPSVDESFELNVNTPSWSQVAGPSGIANGSSVMYLPGHILYSGGAPSAQTNSNAVPTAATIDLTSSNPTWHEVAPMNYARVYHTLTMLADGQVLAVGGEAESDNPNLTADVTQGVLPVEIWNPASNTWTTDASLATARNYHSTAVLLPDGTVLIAGGGHEDNNTGPGQYSAQVYSPPYLHEGSRPTISSVPPSAGYGSTIPVGTPDAASIGSVNLVSLGADTHQIDMDQHFVPLTFGTVPNGLSVQLPSSSSVAPPGNYMLFILNKSGVPSVASIINLGPASDSTVPSSPTDVSAAAGNASATVGWTPPADHNSPIVAYTVTPYAGGVAGTPVTVSGSQTSATVPDLTNGTAYTFTVSATNGDGAGAPSPQSAAVTPSTSLFVQQFSVHVATTGSATLTPAAPLAAGDRLVVETGAWSSAGATVKAVSDSAGDSYVELTHFTAPDGTEMSVWTAPVTAGAGLEPTVTVTPTGTAAIGAVGLEYAGLSTASDTSAVDQMATRSGTTGSSPATVASGNTAATNSDHEMAVGLYADSGFGDKLSGGSGYTVRVNISPTSDMELLAEDQVVPAGSTPSASTGTGAATAWLMATIVFKNAGPVVQTVPGSPTNVEATAGNGSASLTWAAPADGGSPINTYTVTPYLGSVAQPAATVTGSPPPTSVIVGGLAPGDTYTFTVTATNGIGQGAASAPSNAVTPTSATVPQFVQQASKHVSSSTSVQLVPASALGAGDRLVVETATWSSSGATVKSVTDSSGDTFVELLHFKASDGTEMSVWSAPVTAGAGTTPTVTVTPASPADLGVSVLEYSGLSSVPDSTVMDSSATATGTTGGSTTTVSSGPTSPSVGGNELALGFYADSGFGDNLVGGTAWTVRTNTSPTSNVEFLAEDQLASTGLSANASFSTGASTVWLAATLLLKTG